MYRNVEKNKKYICEIKKIIDIIKWRVTLYKIEASSDDEIKKIEKTYLKYKEKINEKDNSKYFWRSVAQYSCQIEGYGRLKYFFLNAAAIILLPKFLLKIRTRKKNPVKNNCDYLKINNYRNSFIPEVLKENTVNAVEIKDRYLITDDLKLVINLCIENLYFNPLFIYKILGWIASVRPYLDIYNPKCLIQYCEYSATSSLRRLYLNEYGIRIANISHGEEDISSRNSFCSFDEYYVWSVIPNKIHQLNHIESTHRITFNPCENLPQAPVISKSIIGLLWPVGKDDGMISTIIEQLRQLDPEYPLIIRPHPAASHFHRFKKIKLLKSFEISNPHEEDINSFINRTSLIIGVRSAAMIQADLRGRKIVYINNEMLRSARKYNLYYSEKSYIEANGLANFMVQNYLS